MISHLGDTSCVAINQSYKLVKHVKKKKIIKIQASENIQPQEIKQNIYVLLFAI